MSNNKKFAKANYLIYTALETKMLNGAKICGSLYLDYYPETEEEAIEMLEQAKSRSDKFHKNLSCSNTIYRYGYHSNRKEWWNIEN